MYKNSFPKNIRLINVPFVTAADYKIIDAMSELDFHAIFPKIVYPPISNHWLGTCPHFPSLILGAKALQLKITAFQHLN